MLLNEVGIMDKEYQDENKGIPLSLKVVAFGNILLASYLIVIVFPFFVLWVIFGFVDYISFCGFWDWFLVRVITRGIITISYFSCFLLFLSGLDILDHRLRAKKLMAISVPLIVFGILWYLILLPSIVYKFCPKNGLNLESLFTGLSKNPVFITAILILGIYFLWLLICILKRKELANFFKNQSMYINLWIPLTIFLSFYLLGFLSGSQILS